VPGLAEALFGFAVSDYFKCGSGAHKIP
jgi:hypothetical protein